MYTSLNLGVQHAFEKQILLSFSEFLKKLNCKIGSQDAEKSILENINQNQILHILIADDDPDDQELLSEAIAGLSPFIKISLAENGKDLMNKLGTESHPDLVFLDLNMPAMNGLECLAKIKENPVLNKIPVLIYSTSAHAEQVEQTYKQGASFYIQKPSNFFDIRNVMNRILNHTVEEFFVQPPRGKFLLS